MYRSGDGCLVNRFEITDYLLRGYDERIRSVCESKMEIKALRFDLDYIIAGHKNGLVSVWLRNSSNQSLLHIFCETDEEIASIQAIKLIYC